MLPPKVKLPADQQRLLELYRGLSDRDRHAMTAFAEFLAQRPDDEAHAATYGEAGEVPLPKAIPRPDSESVIAAIKRLSETFPMLDRDRLFHETSELMTAHVMRGKSSSEVIDELEVMFRRHYEQVRSGNG
ncbi:MAG: hypothetical protein KDJ39_04075 [Gammaproteobacteria bacterium]|nr:hypothetical protein [Gammaproteobacteria bacterium]MCP5298654.1 hypothetical protein [Chromatiaceae bacterium]